MKQCFFILSFLFYTALCIANEDISLKNKSSSHETSSDNLRFIMLNLQSALNSSKHSDIQQHKILNDNMPELIRAVEDLLQKTELMKTKKQKLRSPYLRIS